MTSSLPERPYQASSGSVTSEGDFVTAGVRRRLNRGRGQNVIAVGTRVSVDDEFITRSRGCLQKLGRGGVRLDLLSQAMDELLQQLPIAGVAMSPDLNQEAVGADRMSRICQ